MITTRDGLRVKFADRLDGLNVDTSGYVNGFFTLGGAFTYYPWLKNIAHNYSRYRLHSVRLGVAGGLPTDTPGTVTLAYLPEFTDVQNWFAAAETASIFQMTKSTTAPIWSGTGLHRDNPLSVGLKMSEIHQMSSWLYTGAGIPGDQNTRYAGAFTLQVSPAGVTGSRGSVFIEYDIEFVQPTSPIFNPAISHLMDGSSDPLPPPLEGGWNRIPIDSNNKTL